MKRAGRSAFIASRRLLAFALCSAGILLALLGFAAPSQTTPAQSAATANGWSIVNSPNGAPTPTDNSSAGVTCPTASDCWAVGYYSNGVYQTLIQHWNGAAWSVVASPNTSPIQNNLLRTVACTSASDCWAVGSYDNGGIQQTLTLHWNGAAWSIVNSPNTSADQYNYLLGVTCSSSSQCWGVGYHSTAGGLQTLIMRWDGLGWAIVTSPNTSPTENNLLFSVTCSSASDCWAVGSHAPASGADQTLVAHWDGNAWTIVNSPNTLPTQRNYLSSVTCASASQCWAVGYANNGLADQTLIAQWNGAAWSIASSPNSLLTQNNRLSDVNARRRRNAGLSVISTMARAIRP